MTEMPTNFPSSVLEYVDRDNKSPLCESIDCLSEPEHCKDCNAGCTTPLNTLLDAGSLKILLTVEIYLTDFSHYYTSNTGPPDPFPPRSSNLT